MRKAINSETKLFKKTKGLIQGEMGMENRGQWKATFYCGMSVNE